MHLRRLWRESLPKKHWEIDIIRQKVVKTLKNVKTLKISLKTFENDLKTLEYHLKPLGNDLKPF